MQGRVAEFISHVHVGAGVNQHGKRGGSVLAPYRVMQRGYPQTISCLGIRAGLQERDADRRITFGLYRPVQGSIAGVLL